MDNCGFLFYTDLQHLNACDSKDTSLAKRCTVIGSVFATLNVRSKAMPKEEMIVCKMNGVFPELFGKCDVTSCISVYMKCLKESEKCLLRN